MLFLTIHALKSSIGVCFCLESRFMVIIILFKTWDAWMCILNVKYVSKQEDKIYGEKTLQCKNYFVYAQRDFCYGNDRLFF